MVSADHHRVSREGTQMGRVTAALANAQALRDSGLPGAILNVAAAGTGEG